MDVLERGKGLGISENSGGHIGCDNDCTERRILALFLVRINYLLL